MTQDLPSFYNDLELSRSKAWTLLENAARDRKSPMHTLTVASIDNEGRPSQRIMVLREVAVRKRGLRFHTDIRSTKVQEFGDSPKNAAPVSILAYHPEERVQLRLTGKAWIERDSGTADVAWHMSTPFARRCYMAEAGPGAATKEPTSGLPSEIEGITPTDEDVAPARENFAVLLAGIAEIEWLYLANAGHRRARFTCDKAGNKWQGEWLIP